MFMRCVQSIIILIKLRAVQHLFGGRKKKNEDWGFSLHSVQVVFFFLLQRLKVSHYALSNCNVRVQPLMADGYYQLLL